MIRGIYTAIISPFSEASFGINESVWRQLIERQIAAGIDGIVIAGSTGEGQTMYPEEWESSLRMACEYREKIQIMASAGASATWQSIERVKRAKEFGAHSCLVSSPPYNKPTQKGLIAHFEAIYTACSDLPIMVYNIPGRTAVNIQAETMTEIFKIDSVHSLKESSGDWNQFLQMQMNCPKGKTILSGDDPSALAFWLHGAKGLVSVLSNICPKAVKTIWNSFEQGNQEEALKIFDELQNFTKLLFCESNPIPTKYVMSKVLGVSLRPRLPLLELSLSHREKLDAEIKNLQSAGWIEK